MYADEEVVVYEVEKLVVYVDEKLVVHVEAEVQAYLSHSELHEKRKHFV